MVRAMLRRASRRVVVERLGNEEEGEAVEVPLPMLENPEVLMRRLRQQSAIINRQNRRIYALRQVSREGNSAYRLRILASPHNGQPLKRVRVCNQPLLCSTPLPVLQALPTPSLPLRQTAYRVEVPLSNDNVNSRVHAPQVRSTPSHQGSHKQPSVKQQGNTPKPITSRKREDNHDYDDGSDSSDDDDDSYYYDYNYEYEEDYY